MKGDFTRITFKPEKRFTRVLKQQGRVDLDADLNELVELLTYLARTQAKDIIGQSGAPKTEGGFLVTGATADGSDFSFTPERIYVDGILCQLSAGEPTTYLTQVNYPTPPALNPQNGRSDLIYLDVWERHITALEDPDIREVALGGPDTTTRTRTVWQVKTLAGVGNVTCSDEIVGWPPVGSNGRLTAAATQPPAPSDPCTVPAVGGYRGLENRLYRVEIHTSSDGGAPTFKWSRDNGAVVFAVEELIPTDAHKIRLQRLGRDQVLSLHVNDWVEVLDDTAEWMSLPGMLTQITDLDNAERLITLSQPISGYDAARHAKVRRWDQPSDAIPVTTGVPIALEDGVEITFEGATFQTGDYWMFAARTATASVEVLTDEPAQGIHHHYCALALITWAESGGVWSIAVQDCRPQFPPLTNICAEDVCFDNDNCQLPGAKTVQDALDLLCAANDLRHHNKHLHGWGIVCGLQVECGPDEGERRHVTVRDGYALDCEGNDLILRENVSVDILAAIARLEEQDPNNPILNENGDGEVCLRLGMDEQQLGVIVERHGPADDSLQAMLQGTLLMDFYNDCIKVLVDFIQAELTPGPDETGVVSPGQKRLTTFLNLLVQLWSPAFGRYVFLSAKEDEILRNFYEVLRTILQSHTFCAMFENARPFPDYPFNDFKISTIFGKNYHGRLRIHPNSQLGYTVGASNKLNIYDLEKEEMVAEVEVPGGDGIVVRDVAFSAEGDRLYAVATVQNTDTIFAIARLSGLEHIWDPITILCDVQMVTLATIRRTADEVVYAIGKGRGLYAIDPSNVPLEPSPLYEFNAAGHLVLSEELNQAYATTSMSGVIDAYDTVLGLDLSGGNSTEFPLRLVTGAPLTGQDDIAIILSGEPWLFVVVDPPSGTNNKLLLRFLATEPGDVPDVIDLQENTEFRLAHVPGSNFLTVSCEDSYQLRSVDVNEPFLLEAYHFPVQISPMAIVVAPDSSQVYVLNTLSNTLTTIEASYLDPSTEQPPGSPEFLAELEAYRNAIFEAFLDLLAGFLQYLKDCLCDHFLVKCPECNGDEMIYLGCASIRGRKVYKVCNFSKRRYVKSFPTVGYWLSLVPIAPFIHRAVEQFCCAILPDRFGRFTSPRATAYTAPAKGVQLRQGVAFARGTSWSRLIGERLGALSLSRQLTADFVNTTIARPQAPVKGATKYNEVVGKPVTEVGQRLEAARVSVAGVEVYDPTQVTTNLRLLAATPPRILPGSQVTLYQQEGVVKYYTVTGKTAVSAPTEAQPTLLTELESIKANMGQMQTQLVQKDTELAVLRNQLQVLELKQNTPAETGSTKVAEMETELKELRSFRAEVSEFMKKMNR